MFFTTAPLSSLVLAVLALSTNALPTAETAEILNLSPREFGTAASEHDLNNNSGCKAVTVIFARGTTEFGNVGSLVGPPFFAALASAIGNNNLAVQGVKYPASVYGFLDGGDAPGSALMASLVQQAIRQCPKTKVVMSGYSQGGQLVHNAARMLDSSTSQKISSVVIFGDPNNGKAVGSISADKTKIFCHKGDNICAGGILIFPPHLTYAIDASAAAAFVRSRAGL